MSGIDVRQVVEKNLKTSINTGIAHKDLGVGQVGASLARPSVEMFGETLAAFAEQYGYWRLENGRSRTESEGGGAI